MNFREFKEITEFIKKKFGEEFYKKLKAKDIKLIKQLYQDYS